MPLDAICLSALKQELSGLLVGSRIDKIHQPARDEVLFSLRSGEGGHKLLLSASPTRPRAQMTKKNRENPVEPPMFCMLLRKHLSGGRIVSIEQPPMERLLEFSMEASDELGDRTIKKLILEAMGRHSNLILLDGEGRIIDCLRKVDQDMSAQRQILPGLFYRLPPAQEKHNPLTLKEEERQALLLAAPPERKIEAALLDAFSGLSPLIARELAFEASGTTDGLVGDHREEVQLRLGKLMDQVSGGLWKPYLLIRDGKPVDFSFRPILQYGPGTVSQEMESFSDLLDEFYTEREQSERVRQKGQDLIKTVTTARDRLRRKLALQEKELIGAANREQYRQMGDLITANLYRMDKGMKALVTENFYDPENQEITVKLDPLRTPQQNAAKYYKDYNKAKTAEQMLTEQIAKGEKELTYLESVLESLGRAEGERDLEEIRGELESVGYVRRRSKAKNRMKRPPVKPLEFFSSTGLRISVGRNNVQNDELTMKLAGKRDLWFHTQKIHGSHVILWLDGGEADMQSIEEAAILAAYYSQGRGGAKIPVDWAPVKFVKKPSGARPGMVIYTNYETLLVNPEEARIKALQRT